MSTTFGVHKFNDRIELVNGELPEEYFREHILEEEFIEVAFRENSGYIIWKNELAPLLPDELSVYPLDNIAQGIYTIGDVKREIKEYYEHK